MKRSVLKHGDQSGHPTGEFTNKPEVWKAKHDAFHARGRTRTKTTAILPEKHIPKKGDMPISTWKRIKARWDEYAYSNIYKGYYDDIYPDVLINQPGYESLKKEIMEGSKYFEPTEEHYKKFNEPYQPTEKEIKEAYRKIRK